MWLYLYIIMPIYIYYTLLNVQIEWLTAGDCIAGMHEVVVTNRTTDAVKLAMEQNRFLWRVSSTVSEASHIIVIVTIFLLLLLVGIIMRYMQKQGK